MSAAFMPKLWLMIFFLGSGLFFGLGMLAAGVAYVKGYRPWFWLVSLGPVGALLMLLRPNLDQATTPEERELWQQRADWTGGILSGISMYFVIGLPVLGVATYFSLRSVPVAAPPVVMAVPVQSVVDEYVENTLPEQQESPVESSPEAKSDQSSEPSVKPANEQPRTP